MGGGDVIGTAIVNLKSDTSGFISDLTSALGKGQGLFSNFGSNITSSLKGVGGVMTAGITVPIVAAGLFAVSDGCGYGYATEDLDEIRRGRNY